jgi:hypothetical protein
MNDSAKMQLIPFAGVNDFMRDDYRLTILQEVFIHIDQTTPIQKQSVTRLISKGVQIPGFRNSSLAPLPLRVKNSTAFFEKSSEFAGLIIECWSDIHKDLKKNVWELLTDRDWKPLPLSVNRSQLPGFKIDWPKTDSFGALIKLVRELHPEILESDDHISLMVVWIGNKLPYNLFDDAVPTNP